MIYRVAKKIIKSVHQTKIRNNLVNRNTNSNENMDFNRNNKKEENITIKLEDLSYDQDRLSFKIIEYTSRDVPIRYKTINYEKYPVEWKKSIKSKIIFRLDKSINPIRFCEIELLNLNINEDFKIQIMNLLDVIPSWRQKQLDIQNNEEEIKKIELLIKPTINIEEKLFVIKNEYDNKINNLYFLKNKIKLSKTSKISFVFRIIFSIPTLFFSWIGFVSQKKLEENQLEFSQKEKEIKNYINEKETLLHETKEYLLNTNNSIVNINQQIYKKIELLKTEAMIIKCKNYTDHFIEEDFINLRKKLPSITKFICKGVYIIWNKTKNKYYVGQSKDVYKRLFMNHFNNCDVKNIIFARDWYNNDEFYYKIISVETKDELDNLEKEYIEKYDSFRNGYNNTGGNK